MHQTPRLRFRAHLTHLAVFDGLADRRDDTVQCQLLARPNTTKASAYQMSYDDFRCAHRIDQLRFRLYVRCALWVVDESSETLICSPDDATFAMVMLPFSEIDTAR